MYALRNDFFYDIDDVADVITPRRKSLVYRLVGRQAVGQIVGDRFHYEVHGPFQTSTAQPKHSWLASLVATLAAWPAEALRRYRLHRASLELYGLDDRMLKDIGISRSEIMAVVAGAPISRSSS